MVAQLLGRHSDAIGSAAGAKSHARVPVQPAQALHNLRRGARQPADLDDLAEEALGSARLDAHVRRHPLRCVVRQAARQALERVAQEARHRRGERIAQEPRQDTTGRSGAAAQQQHAAWSHPRARLLHQAPRVGGGQIVETTEENHDVEARGLPQRGGLGEDDRSPARLREFCHAPGQASRAASKQQRPAARPEVTLPAPPRRRSSRDEQRPQLGAEEPQQGNEGKHASCGINHARHVGTRAALLCVHGLRGRGRLNALCA
mmetsp:Transcript_44073/g.133515  ORF Transcript_44073/g.133515 Transcript_44073/m.133515 type:complete len:261 (-) Transcript_44073:18-800(-)